MRRVALENRAQKDKFGSGKHGFTSGNPSTGVLATIPGADWFDSIQEEMAGVIEGAGYALDANKNTQLKTAIEKIFANTVVNNLTDGSTSKALSAAMGKKLEDGKLPKANPVTDGSLTVEASYPSVRLKSTTGTYGAIVEMAGTQPYVAVRPNSTLGGSAGQKVVFFFPANTKDGSHTIATTSDLSSYAQLGTTLAAYGITDAYKSSTVDTLLGNKVDKSVSVSTGTGLTGGGALSSSRSLAIDKANASDLTDGTANKVLTTDIAKAAFDAKVNRAGPEVTGPISIQEHAYPAVRLIPNAGEYAAIFEASGSYPAIYVRPRATPNTSTGQIAGFTFPTKTGNHIVAMTSDLPGSGLLGTQNLNDVLRYGIYGQEQNAQATSARNYPFTEAGYLTVTQGPDNYIQEYVTLSGKRAIRNASKTDGSTWASWTLTDPADKANLSLFANLFTGSAGYQRLPSADGGSGMIIQAGTATVGDDQIVTVTLPIAFPNQFLAVVGMGEYGGTLSSNTVMGAHGQIVSLSQFKLGVSANFDGTKRNTSWIAIGR